MLKKFCAFVSLNVGPLSILHHTSTTGQKPHENHFLVDKDSKKLMADPPLFSTFSDQCESAQLSSMPEPLIFLFSKLL